MDHVRAATKWGPEKEGDRINFYPLALRDIPTHLPKIDQLDGYICNHALYYLDIPQLQKAIEATKGKVMYATMHRFRGEHGTANNGEQSWVKKNTSDDPQVEQTNVLTGEKYVHKDNSFWFDNQSWCPYSAQQLADMEMTPDERCALAWTKNQTSDGTYLFTIVSCPARAYFLDNTNSNATYKEPAINTTEWIDKYEEVKIPLEGTMVPIPVKREHIHVFNKMRSNMAGKTRDRAQFTAHMSRIKVATSSVMADKTFKMKPEDEYNICLSSFWVDAKRDKLNAKTFGDYSSALTTGKYKNVTKAFLSFTLIGLRAKDAKTGLISAIQEVHSKL